MSITRQTLRLVFALCLLGGLGAGLGGCALTGDRTQQLQQDGVFVYPAAAKAALTDPSPLSSHPTVRGMLDARAAAAAVEVIPRPPVHVPSPRPDRMASTRPAAGSPPATVIMPLPRSTRPPAWAARPPTIVCRPAATVTVPPASGTSRLARSAR